MQQKDIEDWCKQVFDSIDYKTIWLGQLRDRYKYGGSFITIDIKRTTIICA